MILIICCIVWYIIGCLSYIYWESTIDDIKIKNIPIILLCGLFGIIIFMWGYSLLGDVDKVIIKKRT